jgi:hypothetical protein
MRNGHLLDVIKVPSQCTIRVQHYAPPVESGSSKKSILGRISFPKLNTRPTSASVRASPTPLRRCTLHS